jgi:hypothetical protein
MANTLRLSCPSELAIKKAARPNNTNDIRRAIYPDIGLSSFSMVKNLMISI